MGVYMNAYGLSTRFLAAAGFGVLFLCTSVPAARADSQSALGPSPTEYTSPLTTQQELEAFHRLQQLRESGHLSAAAYQTRVMDLAAGNKVGLSFHTAAPVDLRPAPSPLHDHPQ